MGGDSAGLSNISIVNYELKIIQYDVRRVGYKDIVTEFEYLNN